jgi:hypothetical protein
VDRPQIRVFYSYTRLFVAAWLFMGGLACLFAPTAAALQRDTHWRERTLRTMPENQIQQWIADRDDLDARTYAYLHIFGVVLGGLGLAMALRETAYLSARYSR